VFLNIPKIEASMHLKAMCLVALVVLVGGCETGSDDAASSSTGGTGGMGSEAGMGGMGDASSLSGSGSGAVSRESIMALEEALVDVGDRVFFGYDQYDLSAEGRETLAKQAALLQKLPGANVLIQGHCDERGTREYNLSLGARRATAVMDYLIVLGIDPDRIQTVSYGEERPAVVGSNDSAFAKNRRAVTVVVGGAAAS
jgi:peptidoglycan-associated lipoprotein